MKKVNLKKLIEARLMHRFLLLSILIPFSFTSQAQNSEVLKLSLMLPTDHSISSSAINDSGTLILTGGEEGLKLWELETGYLLRNFKHSSYTGHATIGFHPNGKSAISCSSSERTIRIWDLESGKVLKNFKVDFPISARFSIDGSRILTIEGLRVIRLRDSREGKIIRSISISSDRDSSRVYQAFFSSDEEFIVSTGSNGKIQFWETSTGELKKQFKSNPFSQVVLSPNGQLMAVAGGGDVEIWDINEERIVGTLLGTDLTESIAFSPDGQTILTGKRNLLRTWGVADLKERNAIIKTNGGPITVSRNRDFFLVGDQVRKFENNEFVLTFMPAIRGVYHLELASDDSRIYFGNKSFDLRSYQINYFASREYTKLIPLSNEKLIVTTSPMGQTRIINVQNQQVVKSFPSTERLTKFTVDENAANFILAEPTLRGGIELWDFNTGELKYKWLTSASKRNPLTFDLSKDGKFALAASSTSLKLWDTANGALIHDIISETFIWTVLFSPDGKYFASGHSKGGINIWSRTSGELLQRLSGHDGSASKLAFDSSGDLLASIRNNTTDRSVKVWDLSSGSLRNEFRGHSARLSSVKFSSDGVFIFSSSEDGTVRIWNLEENEEKVQIVFNGYNDWVAVTPDGRFDGTEKGIEQLYYVRGLDVIPLDAFYETYYTPNLLNRILSNDQFDQLKPVNALKPPPKVLITNVENHMKSSLKKFTIEVKATDMGGGIDEIRLYQNRKLVSSIRPNQNDILFMHAFDVSLVSDLDGQNYFKAVGLSNERLESRGAKAIIEYTGRTDDNPSLYLLVVGINEYRNPKYNLNYAVDDALAFKKK